MRVQDKTNCTTGKEFIPGAIFKLKTNALSLKPDEIRQFLKEKKLNKKDENNEVML